MMPAQAPRFTYSCQASTEDFEQRAEFALLRPRHQRPRSRAADERDELAPSQLIGLHPLP